MTLTVEDIEVGKNYFCTYEAFIDPDQYPILAGKDLPPMTTMQGIGQILKRDPENKLVEVIDLETHQRHVTKWDMVSNIQLAD